jgi:hypothetical protein
MLLRVICMLSGSLVAWASDERHGKRDDQEEAGGGEGGRDAIGEDGLRGIAG